MDSFSIQVSRTARIWKNSFPSDKKPDLILVACHGYAMLGKDMVEALKTLEETHQILILAPEALSRFYRKGFSGLVGASWMTSDSRETDIEDYVSYLHQLHGWIIAHYGSDVPVHWLGFSQGVATLVRFLIYRPEVRLSGIWLIAGGLPHDVDDHRLIDAMNRCPWHYYLGRKDPFLEESIFHSLTTEIPVRFPSLDFEWFDGAHEVPAALIAKRLSKMI